MSNPNLRRFPITYDEVFDADIHTLIHGIPAKRRSERLRTLIRLGLAAESGEMVIKASSAMTAQVDAPTGSMATLSTDNEGPPESKGNPRERKRPTFAPPK